MAIGFIIDTGRPEYGTWTFGWWADGSAPISAFMMQLPDVLSGLSPLRVRDAAKAPRVPVAFYQLRADGQVRERLREGDSQLGTWITNPGLADLFEARLVHLIGNPFNGPTGWVNLGSNQEWGVTRNTVGVTRAVGRLEIRRAGGTQVLAQARIICRAVQRP
jgi:hypothetical protein